MTLRQYVTLDEVKEILNDTAFTASDAELNEAEANIDSLIAPHLRPPYVKARNSGIAATLTFNSTTTATLSESFDDNELAYTIIEFLTLKTGVKRAITQTSATNISFDAIAGVSNGNEAAVYIYQLGKAPFYGDNEAIDGVTYKRVNEDIKRAVAYQLEYSKQPKVKAERKAGKAKSESIGQNYSYTLEDEATTVRNGVDIAPKAKAIMEKYAVLHLV